MAELAAVPQQGEPPALWPELWQQGWSIKQSSEGDWYYVHTSPDGAWAGPDWPLKSSPERVRFMHWLAGPGAKEEL